MFGFLTRVRDVYSVDSSARFHQLPRPEGARLNLLLGLLFHALPRPLSPLSSLLSTFRFLSAPLTMLSRKYVNVHACPIIRSSRPLFSFVPSLAISRSIFLPCPPACLWSWEDQSILVRESRIHVVPRYELSRASAMRKRSIAQCFALVLEEKGEEREHEERQREEAGSFLLIPLKASLHGFALDESSTVKEESGQANNAPSK